MALSYDDMVAPAAVCEGETRKYTFTALRGQPQLDVLPATRDNEPWFNEGLRKVANDHGGDDQPRLTRSEVDAVQLEDIATFARWCIKGIRVREVDGGPYVERTYTEDEGRRFLEIVATRANYAYREFVDFIREPRNFTAEAMKVERLGKGSPTG